MKLGVIVPYRGRPTHLRKFKDHIKDYLKSKNISFQLIVVEQTDSLPFNRGKLLNIGFLEALKKRSEKSDNRRFQKERVFAVNVETLNKQIASPKILSYGEIYSKRMLEIRPLVSGRLDYVSEKFVEGGYVKSGDILFRLNQKDYLN